MNKLHQGGVEDVLSSLSFGSLLKARKVLDQSREDESNAEETDSEDEVDSESDDNTTLQVRQEASTYERAVNVSQEENKRKKAEKRSNKHAYAYSFNVYLVFMLLTCI